MNLIQRFNDQENKYKNKLEKIKSFSGKSKQEIIYTKGMKLYILGSKKYKDRGFMAVYKVLGITNEALDEDSEELEAFTDAAKKRRCVKQYRVDVKILKKFNDDKDTHEGNILKLRYRMGIGTLNKKISKEIEDLLKDVEIIKCKKDDDE